MATSRYQPKHLTPIEGACAKVRPGLKLCGDQNERDVVPQVIAALVAMPEVCIVLRTNSGAFTGTHTDKQGKTRTRYHSFVNVYSRLAIDFLRPHFPKYNELAKAKLSAPDIAAGMLYGGRYFAFEIKKLGKKATPGQAAFLDLILAGGGIAAVIYSPQEAVDAIRESLKKERIDGIKKVVDAIRGK